ncbi:MAG: CoB--CoM heterodisulfide reductase iron-sulfur subunit B family protein [Deltaproteobacteria bacterium]|nr:CoB--CoM heterodisulfide reductase iron-sulfur subunit B family protein [Deltaproteobacteria bacterium]
MPALKYAYYPGCASKSITKEADETTRIVSAAFGMELHDMLKANCCGAGLLADYDRQLHLALNARIFAEAEVMGMDILTICSTCLMVMSVANRDLKKDPALLTATNAVLEKAGLHYSGNVRIKHLLWALIEDVGLDAVKKKIKRPLKAIKVAPFYGCHSLRPSDALGFEDPELPHSLDDVIKAVGAEPVDYDGKTKCCGFQADLMAEDMAVSMTARRLKEGKTKGADCFVTPCPFCHINLDNYQGVAEKKTGGRIDMPVLHLAQLVGLALGLKAGDVGLERHLVSAERLFA